MVTLKIKVTNDILQKSAYCRINDVANNCAIALAVRDIFPKAQVNHSEIYPFGRFGVNTFIPLDKKVQRFINEFDVSDYSERICMNEFEFEISIRDTVIRKINIDEIKSLLINHPTLELVD